MEKRTQKNGETEGRRIKIKSKLHVKENLKTTAFTVNVYIIKNSKNQHACKFTDGTSYC